MCKRFALFLLLLTLPFALAHAEGIDVYTLAPVAVMPATKCAEQTAELYCGPTQGSYRPEEQTIDLSLPYVYFGQHDSWAMVAQGSVDAFGPVGWVEAALIDAPYEPQLTFEDGFAAMVEETAALTNDPFGHAFGAALPLSLERGAQVSVLAQYEGWLYVQAEIADTPVRAFIPAECIF